METTPIGADFPHPAAVAAVTFYFVFFLHLHLLPLRFLKQRGGGGGVHHYSGSYFSSGPHLISFLSFSSLTHSRQLIISLFPQIPQCTCNYHAHTCLPPASCLEGGVSISLSLFTSLSLSSPSSSLLSFLIFFFFPPSVIFLLLQVSFLFSRSLPLYVLFHWDKTLKFNNKLLSRSTSSFAFFKMKNNKKC